MNNILNDLNKPTINLYWNDNLCKQLWYKNKILNPKPIGKFYLNVDCCCFCLSISEDLTFSTCLDFLSQPTQIKACCLANRIKGKTFTATCLPCYGFVSMGILYQVVIKIHQNLWTHQEIHVKATFNNFFSLLFKQELFNIENQENSNQL